MAKHGLIAMQNQLRNIQRKAAECITEEGYIKPEFKYKYQNLIREGVEYKKAIFTWQKLFKTEGASHEV